MSATPPRIAQGESYIGRSVVRPQTARLLAGRGVFTDDLKLPRMTHVAFVRSPHAHARILSIDATAARALPGVVAVVTGSAGAWSGPRRRGSWRAAASSRMTSSSRE